MVRKKGYRLFLVAHVVRRLKPHPTDKHSSIARVYAGGVWDLGANMCNLIYVAVENSRHIQSYMTLNVSEYFETSVVTAKSIQEFLEQKSREQNDSFRAGRMSGTKENLLKLTFGCELVEATYKTACDKFANLKPCVCRKMNFPETIMPDDFRNDFYVTVLAGEFQKVRNYEFIVNLVQFKNTNGVQYEETQVDLAEDDGSSSGAADHVNARRFYYYKSVVYGKQDKPKWNEIVNVSIPHGNYFFSLTSFQHTQFNDS